MPPELWWPIEYENVVRDGVAYPMLTEKSQRALYEKAKWDDEHPATDEDTRAT